MFESDAGRAESIRSVFARRRRRQVVVLGLQALAVPTALLCLCGVITDAQILAWGQWFGIGICGVFAAGFLNWRCPC